MHDALLGVRVAWAVAGGAVQAAVGCWTRTDDCRLHCERIGLLLEESGSCWCQLGWLLLGHGHVEQPAAE